MPQTQRITTALLLAAGTGSRLRPLTLNAPKCLTEVGGQPILGRLVNNLRAQGVKRLIVVTGYLDSRVREFLHKNASDMQLDFVFNPDYQTTNNIYSLWLAHSEVREPFLLVECDLVFDVALLDGMMQADKIALSNIQPWMNGTTVSLGADNTVVAFHMGGRGGDGPQYKTVNICSLSLPSWDKILKTLAQYISAAKLDGYYEAVFADLIHSKELRFEAVMFPEERWYEVDTIDDLREADRRFSEPDIGLQIDEAIA